MAVAPRTKAALVSARELPKLVDAAVRAAQVKVPKATPAEDALTLRWELIGRILRERDLGVAQGFADAVVAELKAQNVAASPALLVIDKRILAGFFERPNIPVQREF